jgi:hypothetical protein
MSSSAIAVDAHRLEAVQFESLAFAGLASLALCDLFG